jgi:hypothetical protein
VENRFFRHFLIFLGLLTTKPCSQDAIGTLNFLSVCVRLIERPCWKVRHEAGLFKLVIHFKFRKARNFAFYGFLVMPLSVTEGKAPGGSRTDFQYQDIHNALNVCLKIALGGVRFGCKGME